jgi:hypothetical protein
MGRRERSWCKVAILTVVGWCAAVPFAWTQFTPFNDRSRAMLEGNWQSCRDTDGQYTERVYDGRWAGFPPFELHLGPYHDFAFFMGIQDEHRNHGSGDNLLKPHTLELRGNRASYMWDVAGLRLDVALAGGSREDCESWYVRLQPLTSSH